MLNECWDIYPNASLFCVSDKWYALEKHSTIAKEKPDFLFPVKLFLLCITVFVFFCFLIILLILYLKIFTIFGFETVLSKLNSLSWRHLVFIYSYCQPVQVHTIQSHLFSPELFTVLQLSPELLAGCGYSIKMQLRSYAFHSLNTLSLQCVKKTPDLCTDGKIKRS